MGRLHPGALAAPLAVALLLFLACDDARPTSPIGPSVVTVPPPQDPPRETTGRIAFVSNREGSDAIYLANPDGSGVSRLTSGKEPAWAPGGRRLAFERRNSIYIINVDGSGERRVTEGWQPDWSPDGSRLVYSLDFSIHTIGVDGSGDRRVVSSAHWNEPTLEHRVIGPSWSPDGRSIAFVRSGWDPWALFIVDADGTTPPSRMTSANGESTSWSPDGHRIAYVDGDGGLLTIAPDGTDVQVMGYGYRPDWTPTGALIFDRSGVFLGRGGMPGRIFTSNAAVALIPEAATAEQSLYQDFQPVWSRP